MKKQMFIVDVDVFQTDLFVCLGQHTTKEIMRYAQKNLSDDVKHFYLRAEDEIERQMNRTTVRGFLLTDNERENHPIALFLKKPNIGTLVHELHHYVYYLSKHKGMEEEPEAQAYLMQFMYDAITKQMRK